MFERISLYAVAGSFVALLVTAGCAKQDVVRKDEGIAPVQVSKPAAPARPTVTSSSQETKASTSPAAPSVQQPLATGTATTNAQLQAALNRIYFNFDSATLSTNARTTLAKNAEAIKKETSAKIRIEGNCDERGSAEYNLALGERRAKVAQQYLITLGVPAERLSVISYGKEKPAVQGNTEAAWSKNRRDEFVVIP